MNTLALSRHEFRYQWLTFRRDPMAIFATLGLPLLYMVIFVSLFGNETLNFVLGSQPGPLKLSTVMTANFIAVGVVSAAFFNLAATLVEIRESGELKRFRATPLPTASFIGGHVGIAIALSLGLAGFLAILGRVAYGVEIPLATLPALILSLLVGAMSFACLGFAFTVIIQKASAVVPLGMGLILVLFFISGNFITMPDEEWPRLIRIVAQIFPVKHLNSALLTALHPNTTGTGIAAGNLAVLLIWGLAGLVIAVRWFRWTPSAG